MNTLNKLMLGHTPKIVHDNFIYCLLNSPFKVKLEVNLLLEKLTVPQPVKKFPTSYGNHH